MDPEYYGLVEIGFTGLVALGFAAYQLWTVRSPRPPTPPPDRSRAQTPENPSQSPHP